MLTVLTQRRLSHTNLSSGLTSQAVLALIFIQTHARKNLPSTIMKTRDLYTTTWAGTQRKFTGQIFITLISSYQPEKILNQAWALMCSSEIISTRLLLEVLMSARPD